MHLRTYLTKTARLQDDLIPYRGDKVGGLTGYNAERWVPRMKAQDSLGKDIWWALASGLLTSKRIDSISFPLERT
jgi:hypothetical protein